MWQRFHAKLSYLSHCIVESLCYRGKNILRFLMWFVKLLFRNLIPVCIPFGIIWKLHFSITCSTMDNQNFFQFFTSCHLRINYYEMLYFSRFTDYLWFLIYRILFPVLAHFFIIFFQCLFIVSVETRWNKMKKHWYLLKLDIGTWGIYYAILHILCMFKIFYNMRLALSTENT